MMSTEIYITMSVDQCVIAVSFCDVCTTTNGSIKFNISYHGPEDAHMILSHVSAFLRRCEKSARHFKICQIVITLEQRIDQEKMDIALTQELLVTAKLAKRISGRVVVLQTRERQM